MIEYQGELLQTLVDWAKKNFSSITIDEEALTVTAKKGQLSVSIAVRSYHYELLRLHLETETLLIDFDEEKSLLRLEVNLPYEKVKLTYQSDDLGFGFYDNAFDEITKDPVDYLVLWPLQKLPLSLKLYGAIERIVKAALKG